VNPLKRGTGSNLVDAGRAAVRVELICGETSPKPAIDAGGETIGECLRQLSPKDEGYDDLTRRVVSQNATQLGAESAEFES
jgi:hypothetical protein